MQAKQTAVITTMIVCTLVVLLLGFYAVSQIPEVPDIEVPTTAEIQNIVNDAVNSVDVPTATEIAAQLDIPDTKYSVEEEEKTLAEELAVDEFTDRDFKEDLADYINGNCDVTDIDRHDITRISVRDVDVRLHRHGDGATVEFELKVFYDNFGDNEEPESARVVVEFDIDNLDRDDDYEDAEVDGYSFEDLLTCSTN